MIATSSTIRVTTIFALTTGLHLLLPAAAHADTRAASAAPASVTVSGNRALHDPAEFLAANSRILGRTFASSCNFMSGYNPYDDDIFIDYITGFGGITDEQAKQQATTAGFDHHFVKPIDPASLVALVATLA